MNLITETINVLKQGDYLAGGKHIEIAKGKYQLANNMKIALRKIKRNYYSNDN